MLTPTLQSRIFFFFSVGALSFSALVCAGQVAPTGGPKDTTPPEIILTQPVTQTLNYHENGFSLVFSKYVDRRSVEEAIFISPDIGVLAFDWGTTDVSVRFSDSLRRNATYVITIGTDVVDIRNRNRMAKSYTFSFSTGDHIDSGMISGKVFDPKPEGIMVFAYQLDSRNPDTLNPSRVKPDYLTQIGKDGSFVLPFLGLGRYRVVAVRDEYRDLYYDVQTDEYGVPVSDVTLAAPHPRVSGLQFRLVKEDTTPPFLSNAKAIDRNHVLLRFSEDMDTVHAFSFRAQICDSASGSLLETRDFSFLGSEPTDAQVVTAQQDSTAVYRLVLDGFMDLQGNKLKNRKGEQFFAGSGLADTLRPAFSLEPMKGGTRNVPADQPIRFLFTEAVMRSSFEHGFSLRDSLKNGVDGTFKWWNSMEVQFITSVPLMFGMEYGVKVVLDSVVDYGGNAQRAESTWTMKFHTVEESQLSSISGLVVDPDKTVKGKICLTVTPVSLADVPERTVLLQSPGSFTVGGLPDGRYSIFAFGDDNGDGKYTFGRAFPFRGSEPFVYYPDSLKIRSRWPIEGVTVRFKGYSDQ